MSCINSRGYLCKCISKGRINNKSKFKDYFVPSYIMINGKARLIINFGKICLLDDEYAGKKIRFKLEILK